MRRALPLLLLLAAALPVWADIATRLDRPAEDLPCTKWWNGDGSKMKAFQGRVVLVHFSDPRKSTSKAFTASLAKVAAKFGEKGLALVEVVLADEDTAAAHAGNEAVTWPVGVDPEGVAEAGYPGSSVPRTYLVGPDGRIVWHAHVGALTDELVDAQLARTAFFDPKQVPKRCRAMATAAGKRKFATALAEAAKIDADSRATTEEKALVSLVRSDLERHYAFHLKLADTEIHEKEYGQGWARLERLLEDFAGTDRAAAVEERIQKLKDSPIAVHVREGERQLDEILERAGSRKKNDLRNMIGALEALMKDHGHTVVGPRAKSWHDELVKRLAEIERKR